MTFTTPWAVGGGAEHQVEIARQSLFDSTGGAEGISLSGNLRVAPLAVPGTKVRVAPGGAILVNRYPGGDGQSYSIRNQIEVEVDVTPTGSSGGRSDLIVARVEDPQYEGQPPADPNLFQYTWIEIIEGVSPSTRSARDLNLNYPAVALARIDLPASTGTVTAAHIADLRRLARPRSERFLRAHALVAGDGTLRLTSTGASGQAWPNVTAWRVDVPEWAQRARIVCTWAGVRFDSSGSVNAYGGVWGRIGAGANPDGVTTQETQWDTASRVGVYRDVLVAAEDVAVPAGLRGTTGQPVYLMGRVKGSSGSGDARPTLDLVSAAVMDIEFYETAV